MQRAITYPLWIVDQFGYQAKNYTRIGKNFKVYEFACNCGCSPILIHPLLGQGLGLIRNYIGEAIKINSAYRCSKHNYKVGGHPNSFHMLGLAADIRTISKQNMEKLYLISLSIPEIGGVGKYLDINSNILWLHIDFRPKTKKKSEIIKWEIMIK